MKKQFRCLNAMTDMSSDFRFIICKKTNKMCVCSGYDPFNNNKCFVLKGNEGNCPSFEENLLKEVNEDETS